MRFSAPASSANLGPGFDCLALALTLRNELEVKRGSGKVTVEGEGLGSVPADHTNLVARAFEAAAPGELLKHDLHCINRVPLARGLGSSTAAAALGLMAGWQAAMHEWTPQQLFDHLAELDGHPDNAAACAFGGLDLAYDGEVWGIEVGDWLEPIVVIPDRELPTSEARTVLPTTYTCSDMVTALGNMAMLMMGMLDADPQPLARVLQRDTVHEPYRASLVPELAEVRAALAGSDTLGATISGAGPSVLVWCEAGGRERALDALHAHFDVPFPRIELLDVEPHGARRER